MPALRCNIDQSGKWPGLAGGQLSPRSVTDCARDDDLQSKAKWGLSPRTTVNWDTAASSAGAPLGERANGVHLRRCEPTRFETRRVASGAARSRRQPTLTAARRGVSRLTRRLSAADAHRPSRQLRRPQYATARVPSRELAGPR